MGFAKSLYRRDFIHTETHFSLFPYRYGSASQSCIEEKLCKAPIEKGFCKAPRSLANPLHRGCFAKPLTEGASYTHFNLFSSRYGGASQSPYRKGVLLGASQSPYREGVLQTSKPLWSLPGILRNT